MRWAVDANPTHVNNTYKKINIYLRRSHPWINKKCKYQGWNKYNMLCVTMMDATHSDINNDT